MGSPFAPYFIIKIKYNIHLNYTEGPFDFLAVNSGLSEKFFEALIFSALAWNVSNSRLAYIGVDNVFRG